MGARVSRWWWSEWGLGFEVVVVRNEGGGITERLGEKKIVSRKNKIGEIYGIHLGDGENLLGDRLLNYYAGTSLKDCLDSFMAFWGFNSLKKELEDEMQMLESENQTLMLKERVSKQELQDAHKEAFETKIVKWSLANDLLAMVIEDSKIRLHRFYWRRLWTISPSKPLFIDNFRSRKFVQLCVKMFGKDTITSQ
ncbi:hypothetical protein LguiB_021331 [Lonicera macranthoides]